MGYKLTKHIDDIGSVFSVGLTVTVHADLCAVNANPSNAGARVAQGNFQASVKAKRSLLRASGRNINASSIHACHLPSSD